MAETLFISDLHLSGAQPGTVALFRDFLSARARQADALYILGDLFDAWLGDDNQSPPIPDIIAWLRELSDSGVQIALMHGNRDFLLGDAFAQAAGCRLLEDPIVIDLYGTPTLLMHGDLLCTDDTAYLNFRAQVRNPIFIRDFLSKTLEERMAIAAEMRRKSGEATSVKAMEIMDVNAETVARVMEEHHVRQLIHGHTHRPATHRLTVAGEPAIRYVLADWRPESASVLRADAQGLQTELISAD